MSLQLESSLEERRAQFFALQTRQDIARLLDVDDSQLVYHLYIISSSERYTIFEIPKNSGGVRRISAPATALKIIQRKLNQVLQCVYEPKPSVRGFVLDQSIVSNAQSHVGRRHILNVDLRDFFPSINFGRVRGMFMAVPYSRNPNVATVLAQICCFNNELPQGAPTSPIVSNMLCAKMDSQLQRLAEQYRCFYTRYADDITFSTNLRTFPQALATRDMGGRIVVGNELGHVIEGNGFEVNSAKVRLQKNPENRQEVTGLTVNMFPNVRRSYVHQIRAMLHAWKKFGEQAAQSEFLNHNRKHRNPQLEMPLFRYIVKGKIEYLGMVRGKDDDIYLRFLAQLRELAPGLVRELAVAQAAGDIYSRYETGLERLLERLSTSHPRHMDALSFESQLRENIDYCRRYGEDNTHLVDRHRIIDQLNRLAINALRTSFNELCRTEP